MVDFKFKMNFGSGLIPVDPPLNWPDIEIQLIWDSLMPQLQLQSINFVWGPKTSALIKDYFDRGMTGGTGILEGPGLEVDASLPGFAPVNMFKGCLNTADRGMSIENDRIMAPLKESGKTDWFRDTARSFRFEYLASLPAGAPGRIQRSDYKQTPYAISTIPDYTQAMLLSVSLFIIVKESVDCVAKIVSLTVRAVSQSLSWLQLVGTIIEIVLYLIYLVAIITASAKLIQDIADNLLQPKKTKLCMRELDLFLKGCEYMGLNFVSPIYGYGTADKYSGRYVNATIMPVKIKIPDGDPALNVFTNGRPPDETSNAQAYGYYDDGDGTFASFVQFMEGTYHAEAVVVNDTLFFTEKNDINEVDAFPLPNEGVVGNTFLYPQPYSTNASEIPAVYGLRCRKDDQDLNTYNDYKGTFAMAQAIPNIVTDQKNQLLSGAKMIDLPFSLARRKVGLTKLESSLILLLDQFAHMLSGITNSVDHATSQMADFMPDVMSAEDVGLSNSEVGFVVSMLLGNPAGGVISLVLGSDGLPILPSVTIPFFSNDRIGWMLLSSDFTGVQKRFIGVQHGDDWYIDENNSAGTFVITFNPALNGTFTGTIVGVPGAGSFTGTVTSGLLTGSCTTFILGPISGVVTGTIAGVPGTFTAVISGVAAGGFFNGNGALNSIIYSTVSTQGWGSALSLLEDFHYTELIAENQWLIYENKTFKFSLADFIRINQSNILTTADGRRGKFGKIVWRPYDDLVHKVEYRIKQKYTNNYTIKITTDNG